MLIISKLLVYTANTFHIDSVFIIDQLAFVINQGTDHTSQYYDGGYYSSRCPV